MATTLPDADTIRDVISQYAPGTGPYRYARFCEDFLDFDRTRVFDELARALNENKQTLVVGGNGLGKSYGTSALAIAALYCNPDTVVPITAGNGDTVKNSIWKNVKSLWRNSPLPGDYKDNDRSLHTEFDDKWFLECHAPKSAEDLEGDHNNNVIYIIEEAEKPGVTETHIDSARSTLAEDDPILVLCNPPTGEANVVAKLEGKASWEVLRFPTWESRNARHDRGLTDKPKIGGLSGVGKMRADWTEYHDSSWPGVETAIRVSSPWLTVDGTPTVREWEADRENPEFREDLHEKWYKRRAGISPPQDADTWRPWSISDVEAAYRRDVGDVQITPEALGIDVARQVDETKATGLHGPKAVIEYASQGPHPEQRRDLTELIREWPPLPIEVDAIGKGEPLAEELDSRFPDVRMFGSNEVANDEENYRYKWDEGLQLIGEWLRDGGSFDDSELYEELKVGARVLAFSERALASRGGKIIEATSKEELKDALGRSPDALDSLLMALYAREYEVSAGKPSPVFGR